MYTMKSVIVCMCVCTCTITLSLSQVTPNGTVSVLMLSSLDVTDAAVYYCFAAITSNHSIHVTASVRLTVNCKSVYK